MKHTLLALFCVTGMVTAATEPSFPHPERIKYDPAGFQIEGKDIFLYGGAFHYFRCPKELWADRFQKIKEAGFNTVETYVPWNYHERKAPKGPGDYSQLDLKELDEWITMAEKFGFYVIIRPGPYICAEWSGGGYPQWLVPLFKPKNWPDGKVWLQTDDKNYLAWNKHWYDAVTRVVAPHQITRKKPGEPGVILFQIENEYERLTWLDTATKTRHLAALAKQSRDGGIDVPLVTCWTRQSRDSKEPELRGVFDFMNFYPKWDVEKKLRDFTNGQRKEQPYAPAASMELQGGWYSEVGGKLSEEMDGVQPVQTQNLALYCLQLGYSAINFYMLFGGTNFDDWASREATTTYDFFAAIREHGGVGDKYRRLAGIGALLKEHGTRLVRSAVIELETEVSDPDVKVALRKAGDGTRYFFVRTENRSGERKGTIRAREKDGQEFTFDFQLEPFGSQIFILPPGATDASRGEWYPKLPAAPPRPENEDLPAPVKITKAGIFTDPIPTQWEKLKLGEPLEGRGIVDYHFRYYRVHPKPAEDFTVRRIGKGVINSRSLSDGILALADGKLLPPKSEDQESITFTAPPHAKDVVLLHENVGLHHHTKAELEKLWPLSLSVAGSDGKPLPLEFAGTERETGIRLSKTGPSPAAKTGAVGTDSLSEAEGPITWYRLEFELPATKPGVWVPWLLSLHARGNGFLYLNGHALGRTWDVGPQRKFYLPESWLNFGPGTKNILAVSLRPTGSKVGIESAEILPAAAFAEKRQQP